jgi:hypothetical protein
MEFDVEAPCSASRKRRIDGIIWAIKKTRASPCTFSTKNNIIDFGFGGTRVVISMQDN